MILYADTTSIEKIKNVLDMNKKIIPKFVPHFKQAVQDMQQDVRLDAPVSHKSQKRKTQRGGWLARNTKKKFLGKLTAEVFTDESLVPYAKYVYLGTRPHDIVPRNKKALAWFGTSGSLNFAKLVKHPGTKANPYIRKSVERHQAKFTKALQVGLAESFKEVLE
jgi:hypothetical protein